MKASDLLAQHRREWQTATEHAFLGAVRDGSLPKQALAVWLSQDYLFVADLVWFQARLLARAPRNAQAVIANGLVALEAELTWFESRAGEQSVDLAAPPHAVTRRYREQLEALDRASYVEAIGALWAIENVYFLSWQLAAPGAAPFREYVAHWTMTEFAEYVTLLECAFDAALAGTDDASALAAEHAVLAVVRLEREFWDMAWTCGGAARAGRSESASSDPSGDEGGAA